MNGEADGHAWDLARGLIAHSHHIDPLLRIIYKAFYSRKLQEKDTARFLFKIQFGAARL